MTERVHLDLLVLTLEVAAFPLSAHLPLPKACFSIQFTPKV